MLVEQIGRIIQVTTFVTGWRQENEFDLSCQRLFDYFFPSLPGAFQAKAAIIKRVVNQYDIWAQRQDIAAKTVSTTGRCFAADGRDNNINDCVWVPFFEADVKQMRVSVECVHDRRIEVPRRHAVTMGDNVKCTIAGPRPFHERDKVGKVSACVSETHA